MKRILPYIIAFAAFLIFSLLYCKPLFDGKVLQAGDVTNYLGASNEIREFSKSEGRQVWWTGSMFGGMPSFQISGSTPSGNLRAKMEHVIKLGMYEDYLPAGMIFAYLTGFFLMLLCFGVGPWLSIAGAFALTLSTYFMLIIPAGHLTKASALCCLGPVIGGFYAIFRGRWKLGVPLVLIYGIIGITLHPQMTYYVFLLIGVLFLAELYSAIRDRKFKEFGIATAIFAASLLIVAGTKYSWLDMNQSYLSETMRGGHSELSQDSGKNKGLDFDYATAWSYGRAETMTLLIPGFMGGASGYDLGTGSALEKSLRKMGVSASQARGFCSGAPTYWGEKPFTSGPVYVGAIICFLFILGLLIVRGPYKWALLAATLFSITLAWGRNFEGFSRLFFDWFPMYSKFRAVESILVVAEITIPLLGFLALGKVLKSDDLKSTRRSILTAAGITGGLCLLVAIFGGAADVTSSYDAQWKSQVGDQIYRAILDQRHSLMCSSAWRSLLFVLIGAGILIAFTFKRGSKGGTIALAGILTIAILADMVPVNRHFFGKQNFVGKRENSAYFAMQPWEKQILEDKAPSYRVLNLAANTFNDARTSYRLKSIGGYSAAKLRRYQDLIDKHISRNNWEVINMLNTKYIIDVGGQVHLNPEAMGNAWFVDEVKIVDSADEECAALAEIDLRKVAVSGKEFAAALNVTSSASDPEASIVLDSYVPDRMAYTSNCATDKVAVFSEIYCADGWHLYVDDVETPIARVDYTLRGAVIPAGRHTLRMEFVPSSLKVDVLCLVLTILALLASAGFIFLEVRGLRSGKRWGIL